MIFIILYINDIDSKVMHRQIIVIAFTKTHMCKKSAAICKIPPIKCETRYIIYYRIEKRISIDQ